MIREGARGENTYREKSLHDRLANLVMHLQYQDVALPKFPSTYLLVEQKDV